jgi:hypothetical protein
MFRRLIEAVPSASHIDLDESVDGDPMATTVIASTDDGLWLVLAVALLIPFTDEYGVDRHELQFGVGVLDVECADLRVHLDREGARPYVDDDLRPWVMPCVCAAIRSLVEKVQPASIYRVTKVQQPPDKALRKHELVTKTLLEIGFALKDAGTAPCGGVFWSFE